MFHLELRKFPHTVSRFNQSEQQVQALAARWVSEEWIEVAERKWNVNDAKLTVLEGPELSLQEMAMNRGWRNARRRSEDVTERVLAAARGGVSTALARTTGVGAGGTVASGPQAAEEAASGDLGLLADSLALEVLGALDAGPAALARIWQLAHERLEDRSPAESLALAEMAVHSLLSRGLVVFQGDGGAAGETTLADIDSWMRDGAGTVAIARSG